MGADSMNTPWYDKTRSETDKREIFEQLAVLHDLTNNHFDADAHEAVHNVLHLLVCPHRYFDYDYHHVLLASRLPEGA